MKGKSYEGVGCNQLSLIASLYKAWEKYQVPAIHYHYFLSVLSKKPPQDQADLMTK
jgi:hypothetical protein